MGLLIFILILKFSRLQKCWNCTLNTGIRLADGLSANMEIQVMANDSEHMLDPVVVGKIAIPCCPCWSLRGGQNKIDCIFHGLKCTGESSMSSFADWN